MNSIQEVFPFVKNNVFQLLYEDDEGDFISFSTDGELQEAVRVLYALNVKILKFHLKDTSSSSTTASINASASSNIRTDKEKTEKHENCVKETSEIRHGTVTCDGCGMFPIVGIRYKSTVTEDYGIDN